MKPVVYTVVWDRELTGEERRRLMALLPAERRDRLPRNRLERWDQPLAAWGLLALGCREQWGTFPMPETALQAGGKPWFPAHPNRCFSLSHTEGAAACALWNRPIGVDVERERKVSDALRRRMNCGEEDFLRRWVCREAALKRNGRGGVAALLEPAEGEERCRLMKVAEEMLLALAAEEEPCWVSLRWDTFWTRLMG